MIIVKIIGGLGNQMFQYAYAQALEQKGYDVKIDVSAFETYRLHGGYQLNKYKISLESSSKEENERFYKNTLTAKFLEKMRLLNTKVIKEKSLLFNSTFLDIEDGNYIEGYFQSEKYFFTIRDILLNKFIINEEKSIYTKEIAKKIVSLENSCSLHVRRGDYTNNSNINIHGICSFEYYQKGIKYLEGKASDINYFVFSDDIDWVKENLKIDSAIYVNNKEKSMPHEDLYLMSLCSHNIIANSSFSWWGAWLNENSEKIVISPFNWFSNYKMNKDTLTLLPNTWIKL